MTDNSEPIKAIRVLGLDPLLADIITKMFEDSATVHNALTDNYRAQILDLKAELFAIRFGISELLQHPWTPSTHAVNTAVFYPSEDYIAQYKAEHREGEQKT